MINKDFSLTWKEEETPHLSNRSCFSPTPGMQEASMKLTESLHEVYEPDWYGREDVKMVGEVRARTAPHRRPRGGFCEAPSECCSLSLFLNRLLPLLSLNHEGTDARYIHRHHIHILLCNISGLRYSLLCSHGNNKTFLLKLLWELDGDMCTHAYVFNPVIFNWCNWCTSMGGLQEFWKHAISDYLLRSTDLFSLRLC